MIKKKYKMKRFSVQKALNYGFFYDPIKDNNILVYQFPLYKYHKMPLLYGRVRIFIEENKIDLDVINRTGVFYAPFYNTDKGHRKFVKYLTKKFHNHLDKLDIIEVN